MLGRLASVRGPSMWMGKAAKADRWDLLVDRCTLLVDQSEVRPMEAS